MKRKDLVIGESYATHYHHEAIYLGTVKVLSYGGRFQSRNIGHDAGTPRDAFAVKPWATRDGEDFEWEGKLFSLQSIECTTAQWRVRVAHENAERKASQQREDARYSKAHALEATLTNLLHIQGIPEDVTVDQYGHVHGLSASTLIALLKKERVSA